MSVEDTRKRAELRGRDAVASWRLRGGVWAAQMYAALTAVSAGLAIITPGGPFWRPAVFLAIWSAALAISAKRIESGSRLDACVMFLVFLAGDVARIVAGRQHGPLGLLISGATLLALGNAVWGTFALHRVNIETHSLPDDDMRPSAGTPLSNVQ